MNKLQSKTQDPLEDDYELTPKNQRKALLNILEDMQRGREVIEEQRKAISNTLTEVRRAQDQLGKRYLELHILKDLLQELGFALNIRDVFHRTIKALKQVMPKFVNFAYITPPTIPGISSDVIYVHAQTPLSKEYLNAISWSFKMSFKGLPGSLRERKDLQHWINQKFSFEFVAGEQKDDPSLTPSSLFNSSLSVGGEMLGFVHVSSVKDSLFSQKDINLVNTILGTAAGAILRLRQMAASEEAKIHSLVDGLSNGVLMFDTEQQVTMMNVSAIKMTGMSSAGFPFSEFTKLFFVRGSCQSNKKEDSLCKILDLEGKIESLLQTGKVIRIDEASSGRLIYEILITPVRDYEKNIIGGAVILHDITHIKEVERMKTEFVSVVSHQLRTPLTAIKLFTEMLYDEDVGKLNIEQKDYMSNISESTERMIKLVNDLLNVSRLETGRLKIEPVLTQIDTLIEEIIKEAQLIAREKGYAIVFKKTPQKFNKMSIDITLLRQVVHNLIMNAIRYSPNIPTKKRKQPEEINVGLEKHNEDGEQFILIFVKDNGIGIPAEDHARIFEKFFRADNAIQAMPEGNGLGLYVVKMVVDAFGGDIWFESKKGNGTAFYVKIPIEGMLAKGGEKGIAM